MNQLNLDQIVLAFILGALTWEIIPWHYKRRARRLITDLIGLATASLPTKCPNCETWVQEKDMRSAKHRVAGQTKICQSCYDYLYGKTRTDDE